ncbi:MAG: hypothetical protein FIB00_01415 [Chloroflexi bacterium]|nr:hypothetical protein [Chloroflexota bacterium]
MAGNSIREQILLAALEALRPAAESLGATVHRSLAVAVTREQCPALVVFPESEAITERANDRVTREITVRVVALARAVPPDAPETQADEILTAAHAALMADGNLGGLALGIREQDCEWEVEDADAVAAAIPARYRITYRTLANDLSQQG